MSFSYLRGGAKIVQFNHYAYLTRGIVGRITNKVGRMTNLFVGLAGGELWPKIP